MNPVYFNTHFNRVTADDWTDRPDAFAIITAYPTTCQIWPQSPVEVADKALEAELRQRSKWVRRLTGSDPATNWAEPGWAAVNGFDEACDIGDRYKQDAIYYVEQGLLYVSYCDDRRSRVKVASFDERLQEA